MRKSLPYPWCSEYRDREEWHQGHVSFETQPGRPFQWFQHHVSHVSHVSHVRLGDLFEDA